MHDTPDTYLHRPLSRQPPHDEHHFEDSESVRDIVIGMSDGLTVPFALAAGLSGAVDSSGIIMTAGLAEVAAGATSNITPPSGSARSTRSGRSRSVRPKRCTTSC